jgi:hypothetical protein
MDANVGAFVEGIAIKEPKLAIAKLFDLLEVWVENDFPEKPLDLETNFVDELVSLNAALNAIVFCEKTRDHISYCLKH